MTPTIPDITRPTIPAIMSQFPPPVLLRIFYNHIRKYLKFIPCKQLSRSRLASYKEMVYPQIIMLVRAFQSPILKLEYGGRRVAYYMNVWRSEI